MAVTIAALVLAGVLSVVAAVACRALIAVLRELTVLRRLLEHAGRPLPLDVSGDGSAALEIGLPSALSDHPHAVLVVLSPTCSAALQIAQALEQRAPPAVWFLLEPGAGGDPAALALALDDVRERVIVDADGSLWQRLGIGVTPVALTLHDGVVATAHGVASAAQVLSLVPAAATRSPVAAGRRSGD